MKKKIFLSFLFLILNGVLFSQQHLSVDLDDPVYRILENAQIKNLCTKLPSVKPYSKKTIIKALTEIRENPNTTAREREIVKSYLDLYDKKATNPWYLEGRYRYDSKKLSSLKAEKQAPPSNEPDVSTDTLKIETTEEKDQPLQKAVLTTVETGVSWESSFSFGAFNKEGVFSTENWLDLYLQGDLSKLFSYRLHMGVGLSHINLKAYEPFTFSQGWDGYVFPIKDVSRFGDFETTAGIMRTYPEMVLSLWDDKIKLNFSRTRREWGSGDGSLLLDQKAQPFVGFEFFLQPVEWFNLSMLTGILEYLRTDHSLNNAKKTQNAYTASQAEFFIKEWASIGINSAVIWPKRYELGYGHPGIFTFIYQNMIGDFDNMQIGFNLGFNIPKHVNFYYNMFIDEMHLQTKPFFNLDRNMYSWQLGAKLAIPEAPFTTLTLQYTKIEPYMYTHPLTDVPWYSYPIDTSYQNHGENLGYHLLPNSDELKLKLKTSPLWYFTADFTYKMVRHGLTADGSTFEDTLVYTPDLNTAVEGDLYWKNFLKDGVYEWVHSISLNGELDLRFVNLPIKVGAGYTFAYRTLREWNITNKKFDYIGSVINGTATHEENMYHLFSLYLKVY